LGKRSLLLFRCEQISKNNKSNCKLTFEYSPKFQELWQSDDVALQENMQQLPQTINNQSERDDGEIIEEKCKMLPFLCLTSKNCWMLKLFQIDYGCN
jgi:hypothetical protein